MEIKQAEVFFNGTTGKLDGAKTSATLRQLKDVTAIYEDQAALDAMDLEQTAYRVELHEPDPDTEGGLQFGTSYLYPGKVGTEYFMTKGHFHEVLNRAEYYWCIKGSGVLLFMDQDRNCWAEQLKPGSLHYIPGFVAHRMVNVGDEILTFGACWPADAGHDYGSIETEGFAARVKEVDGKPQLVAT